MAALVVNTGLQRIGVQASQATGSGVTYSSARQIQTMSIDDSTVAFAATDTALNTGGAITNEFDVVLDSTPTRASQAVTHVATIPTGSGNFTIKRIALHDDVAATVTSSSTTLICGVDAQSLTKTSSFTVTPSLVLTYS